MAGLENYPKERKSQDENEKGGVKEAIKDQPIQGPDTNYKPARATSKGKQAEG